ncbi:fibroblast growth factor 1 isoform X1 [Podarcis lilfordi]|uniref:Fibroblast growth factor n=1 Tax=Podarcis lilfordi TaxID=74358 RepID=A0AA35JVP2_9SAUR|nr:fibroblast growth factor 1 isoform X1 [Podarcis lilfordi]
MVVKVLRAEASELLDDCYRQRLCFLAKAPTAVSRTETQTPRRNGGHFLRILPDGKVDGTMDRNDQHIQLLLSAENLGEVYIKSTESGHYLAMDANGRLYGSQLPTEECLFLERMEENHYNTYTSKMHADKNWFVGLKKNGKSKLGPRTHYGQKAILFLPLPVSPD